MGLLVDCFKSCLVELPFPRAVLEHHVEGQLISWHHEYLESFCLRVVVRDGQVTEIQPWHIAHGHNVIRVVLEIDTKLGLELLVGDNIEVLI